MAHFKIQRTRTFIILSLALFYPNLGKAHQISFWRQAYNKLVLPRFIVNAYGRVKLSTPKEVSKFVSIDGKMKTEKLPPSLAGRLMHSWLLFPFFSSKLFSKATAAGFWNRGYSRFLIPKFIRDYKIDMSEYQEAKYKNFNDFFIRKLKPAVRPINQKTTSFVSPADSKLFVVENISSETEFSVKGEQFNLKGFLQNQELAEEFNGGTLLVFRLAPNDYHRFHFPVNSTVLDQKDCSGPLASVSPTNYAKAKNPLSKNYRKLITAESKKIGKFVMSPIGAMIVGSIKTNIETGSEYKAGDECGYFLFGGSTVVIVLPKGKIKLKRNLIENSKQHLETEVRVGMKIGELA